MAAAGLAPTCFPGVLAWTISTLEALLASKSRPGAYTAAIVFGPSERLEFLRLALPWRSATVPRSVALSMKLTESTGVPRLRP